MLPYHSCARGRSNTSNGQIGLGAADLTTSIMSSVLQIQRHCVRYLLGKLSRYKDTVNRAYVTNLMAQAPTELQPTATAADTCDKRLLKYRPIPLCSRKKYCRSIEKQESSHTSIILNLLVLRPNNTDFITDIRGFRTTRQLRWT